MYAGILRSVRHSVLYGTDPAAGLSGAVTVWPVGDGGGQSDAGRLSGRRRFGA